MMKWMTPFFLFLSGCNFAPQSFRPCMELPESWRIKSDPTTTLVNTRWWEQWCDPILNDLILTALANNKDLKTAAWRVYEFYARFQVARSPLFPEVNLEGSAQKVRFPETDFVPEGFDPITPVYTYGFFLSYELDFWGKFRNAAQEACAEALAEIESRRTIILTLVSSVARTYVLLRQLDRELEIAYQTLEERRDYLHLAKLRFEGGLTSEIEVTQAASAYDETEAAITLLLTEIPRQENLLSVLLGQNPTCILRGRSINQLQFPPQIPAGLPSELLFRRPDILQSENLLVATNAQIGIARAAFFPQISLSGLFGGESFELSELFSTPARAWKIGANFFQPLFTGGRLTGELKIAWAKRHQAFYQYQQTVLNAFREVNDALVAHREAKERAKIEEDRQRAVQEYLHLAWLRYYNGQTDYLTVLDAERQLFLAQIDLTQALGNTFLTLIDLYKALGGGWVLDADCCLTN